MSSLQTLDTHALDQCIAHLVVIAGTSDPYANGQSHKAIAAYLGDTAGRGSADAVDLMDLYNRLDAMQLSGVTADAIRAALDAKLIDAFEPE